MFNETRVHINFFVVVHKWEMCSLFTIIHLLRLNLYQTDLNLRLNLYQIGLGLGLHRKCLDLRLHRKCLDLGLFLKEYLKKE
jgi:hypothetical protein